MRAVSASFSRELHKILAIALVASPLATIPLEAALSQSTAPGQSASSGPSKNPSVAIADLLSRVQSVFVWSRVVCADNAGISTKSTTYDILTSNNLTVAIETEGPGRFTMAEVLQVSVGTVTATSNVSDIDLYTYTSLGARDRPIVNSVATAVGNNKSFSVNAPSVDVDTGGTE